MTLLIDSQDAQLERADCNAHHAASLLRALGDPTQYEYRGEWFEDKSGGSYCSCGHPIVNVFPIYHQVTGAMKPLGSTCIDHFATITPALYAALVSKRDEIALLVVETKKKVKRAQADARNADLWGRYCVLRDQVMAIDADYAARKAWSPRPVWAFANSWTCPHRFKVMPRYTRAGDLTRRLNTAIAFVESVLVTTTGPVR